MALFVSSNHSALQTGVLLVEKAQYDCTMFTQVYAVILVIRRCIYIF